MEESKEVRQIPIEDIIPNRFQPRINFDEKALNELSDSIKQHGIIQPLVLRPLGDKFEIIAGERRYKAATLAGLATVPCIVTEMDDNTSAEVALIENVQRKDLSSIEEAKSYKSMLERSNMTQEELAKKMGLSQSTIANKLRLLNLSDEVQKALSQEKISERHARALLAITDKEEQVKWLSRIINERLTVRQLDLAIKDELNSSEEEADDIPKVDINPDINTIINNAVDINSNPAPINNEEVANQSTQEIAKPTNKFFNYIEDEEVNMNTTEDEPSVETENTQINNDFSFVPEFQTEPENPVNNVVEEEIETLDAEPEVKDETPIFSVDQTESTITSDVNNTETPIEVEQGITENINNQQETNESEPITEQPSADNIQMNEPEEFIFDEDDNTPIETPSVAESQEDRVDVQPIPVIEEEGVVDPVSYYDTLDPDCIDKVKEYVGLDLKKAINSYRDLTNDLNAKGFNISIDETDLNDKYLIEININKE